MYKLRSRKGKILVMNKDGLNKNDMAIVYLFVGLIAFLFFVALYGFKVLNPTYDEWLYGQYYIDEKFFFGQDLTQHYIGWQGFRVSDWTFPIGNFNKLSTPFSMSVIFTDSIPLLAVFFKLFRGILPETFQYFGIYGLMCFILQGVMAVRILRHYIKDKKQIIIAAAFFITVPLLVWRMFMHTALDSQWLILMAFEAIFAPRKFDFKKLIKHFALVAFLCASIHIYLLLYCGLILLGAILAQILMDKKNVKSLTVVLVYIAVAVVVVWLLGGFSSNTSNSLGDARKFSMNLNSFLDSYGYSLLMPSLPRVLMAYSNSEIQYEGYAYLGVGVLLLVITGFVGLIKGKLLKRISDKRAVVISLFTVFVVALILALSPSISLGNKVILDIPLPDFIERSWAVFRATGRAAWILVYIIMFGAIFATAKAFDDKKRLGAIVMVACLLVQLMDNFMLYNVVGSYFHKDIKLVMKADSFLGEAIWNDIKDCDFKHIVLANTTTPYDDEVIDRVFNEFAVGPDKGEFIFLQYVGAQLALENDATFNYFRFSRHFYADSRAEFFRIWEEEDLDEYLFIFNEYNKFWATKMGLNVYGVNGIYIACTKELLDEYKMTNDQIKYECDFSKYEEGGHTLLAGEYTMLGIMELPAGQYYCKVQASDPVATDVVLLGDGVDIQYDVELVEVVGDQVVYKFNVMQDYYAVGFLVGNSGNESVKAYDVTMWMTY